MGKKYTIGVLIGNANSPHTMELMQGIHEASEKLNMDVMFFLGIHTSYYYRALFGDDAEDNYDYQFNIVYDYAWLAKVDALIISYGSLCIYLEDNDKHAFLQRFKGIPYVLVEDTAEGDAGSSIISDNYKGMYQMVEHLILEHGYRRLTYLAGPRGNRDAEERLAAFLDTCQKHQIAVSDDMIEYGDYSSCVEPQINSLLDHYPDMEAMICANDVMAETAYRECAARGKVVGQSIAITGYDDWEMSESMTPPLTTVLQNGIHMGYTALEEAVALCGGKKTEAIIEPAIIKIRSSCGCKNELMKYQFPAPVMLDESRNTGYIKQVSEIITESILLSNTEPKIHAEILEKIEAIVGNNLKMYQSEHAQIPNYSTLISQSLDLIGGKYGHYISLNSLSDVISAYLRNVMSYEVRMENVSKLADITNIIQKEVQSFAVKNGKTKLKTFQLDTWFIPLISRDMMNHIDCESDFYGAALAKMSTFKARRAYLYIFEEPIKHHWSEKWSCPERMYLAARNDGDGVICYEPQERPVITKEQGLTEQLASKESYNMSVFSLFNGEMQYGILVCEITPRNMALAYLGSMQISIALSFFELSKQQKRTQQKLQKLVQEVNEKNEVLGFISEYDQLTGCLNRRGFMEKAVIFCRENVGKSCVLLFGDLDHLKQINDQFGHASGDFAIQTAAQILKSSLGSASFIARIGGDEYVALVPITNSVSIKNILEEIHHKNREFNEMSSKPFYVELSVGYTGFICQNSTAISAIIDEADRYLYDAKKNRRSSIVKEKTEIGKVYTYVR